MNASRSPNRVVDALRRPAGVLDLNAESWSELIRQSRATDLIGRLAAQLQGAGVLDQVPAGPRQHLESALLLSAAQQAEVRREVKLILRELKQRDIPMVVLKGASYVFADLPPATGRLFGDIDILVPKAHIASVEAILMMGGWVTAHHSAYDQRYYRQWMHELPPMQHARRGTVLDVHHSILPQTSRIKMPADRLWDDIVPVADAPGLFVLSNIDIVLHSMTHLLCNEEFSHGLRDLSDIDLLLRRFGQDADFWEQIPARAAALGLSRFLYYGLHQARELLDSPVPDTVFSNAAMSPPAWPASSLMTSAFRTVMLKQPRQAGLRLREPLAESLLFLRAHWLRMPLHLLAAHVIVKSTRAVTGFTEASQKAEQ